MKDIRDTGLYLWGEIYRNKELIRLEKEGFIRGEERGKTMDVSIYELRSSLGKQIGDWLQACERGDIQDMKQKLADLRNVAGCLFLKLQEQT